MSAITMVVGKVTKAAIKDHKGKRFASVVVRTSEHRDGKDYGKKYEVTVRGKGADEAASIAPGTLVSACGNAGARCFEYQGKWYAQSTISAFGINVVSGGAQEEPTSAPPQRQAPASAPPASQPATEEDDVPF